MNRALFLKIYSEASKPEVRIGFHLTDKHVNCSQGDKQNVRLAVQVLSKRTAKTIERLADPGDKATIAMGKFIG